MIQYAPVFLVGYTGFLGLCYHGGRKWTEHQMNKIVNDVEQPLELKEKAKEVLYKYDLEMLNESLMTNNPYPPDEKEDY